jgi:HlyD family secretion protein
MKKILIGLVLAIVIVGGGFFGYSAYAGTAPKPTPTPPPVQVKASNSITAEGAVAPVKHASLAFKTGGRITELPVHEGDTVKAGAVLARLDDAAILAQIAQAQAARAISKDQLAQLRAGATAAERQAAQDALISAQATLAKVRAGPTAEQVGPLKANLDNAQAAVSQAQTRYDRIGGDSNPFGGMGPERLALQQATNNYLAAQAAYQDALNHPTASELRAAEAAVTQAQSTIARLDPTPEQITLAEAQVNQAQAAVDLAKTALQDAVLTAPFDGTVTEVDVEVGQIASLGAQALVFADLTKLQVETVDLVEVDVAKVAVGQPVSIKLDALPGQTCAGQVLRIADQSNDHRGDKVYRVTIDLNEGMHEGLRWGMTANVEIDTGQPSASK